MMDEVTCPKCGSETTIRTAKKDDRQYHVCINRPKCRGRVPVDDDLGDDRGEEKPATKPARDITRQRVKPDHPERRGVTAVRKSGKDKRKPDAGHKRKGKVPVEASWGDDWGGPASKPAHDRFRWRRGPSAPERGAEWGKDWDEEAPKTKTARGEPRPQVVSKSAHDKPKQRKEPREDTSPEKEKSPGSRRKRAPEAEDSPEKKERSLIVIIIALVVAFLAIDGMIYAAVVLR